MMNTKLRDDMNFLHGQISALGYLAESGPMSDLLESVEAMYARIMGDLLMPVDRFQALHPCEHQWKQVAPHEFMCAKCGERGE